MLWLCWHKSRFITESFRKDAAWLWIWISRWCRSRTTTRTRTTTIGRRRANTRTCTCPRTIGRIIYTGRTTRDFHTFVEIVVMRTTGTLFNGVVFIVIVIEKAKVKEPWLHRIQRNPTSHVIVHRVIIGSSPFVRRIDAQIHGTVGLDVPCSASALSLERV